MEADSKGNGLSNVIRIDDERVREHLGHIVRGTVEETLNAMLEVEADRLCNAGGKAAELVKTAVSETLMYYAFPEEHWRRIRTNNPLERIMREIRRRTSGAFPDGSSTINLAAARLRHIAGTRWSTKRYLNMLLLWQRNATFA